MLVLLERLSEINEQKQKVESGTLLQTMPDTAKQAVLSAFDREALSIANEIENGNISAVE